jgi:hypothetical protein
MPLSTSNSSGRLIASAFLVAILTVGTYQAVIATHHIPPSKGLAIWEDNVIRAQQYAYGGPENPDVVMVGSSLTQNIKASYIGPGVVNLGVSAGDCQTGLQLIRDGRPHPRVVLVEIDDTISRGLDQTVLDYTNGSPIAPLRAHLSALQQQYQPVGVVMEALKAIGRKRMAAQGQGRPVYITPAFHARLVRDMVNQNNQHLTADDRRDLSAAARSIAGDIAALRARGCRVVLVQIPGNPIVAATPRQVDVRALLHSLFPTPQYEWLPDPPARQWQTNDGQHLIRSDAMDYGAYLRQKLIDPPATDSTPA